MGSKHLGADEKELEAHPRVLGPARFDRIGFSAAPSRAISARLAIGRTRWCRELGSRPQVRQGHVYLREDQVRFGGLSPWGWLGDGLS